MKGIFRYTICSVLLVGLCIFINCASVFAQDFKTTAFVRTDFINPEKGKSYHKQNLFSFSSYGNLLVGIELTQITKFKYFLTKPFIGLTEGPWAVFLGGSFDSQDKDHIFGGFLYCGPLWRLNILSDTKYHIGTNNESKNNLNSFLRLTYPIKNWAIGADTECTYQSSNKHSFYLGPTIIRNLTKNIKLLVKVTKNRSFGKNLYRSRIELQFFY